MDPFYPFHIAHVANTFMDNMKDDMDEELMRIFFGIKAQKEVASSSRPSHQRRDI